MKRLKYLILLLTALYTTGCSETEVIMPSDTVIESIEPTQTEETLVEDIMLCIGDSITEGVYNSNYPKYLDSMLDENWNVMNFGYSGSSASDNALLPYRTFNKYRSSLKQENVKVIIFMIGTNDSALPNWNNIEEFSKDYLSLLSEYEYAYPNAVIILSTISKAYYLDTNTPPLAEYEIQPEIIAEINSLITKIAKEKKYDLVDIFTLTNNNPTWFTSDGIHPDDKGNYAIALEFYNYFIDNSILGNVN